MIEKITIYLLCCLIILMNTGCNKQENNEENQISTLCNQIENDITSYQNNQITRDDLYNKLESYQFECADSLDNVCITLKAIISVPKEREDLQEESAKRILKLCNQE